MTRTEKILVGGAVALTFLTGASWRLPAWIGQPSVTRGDLLGVLKVDAKYERLDLVVEYPFGRSAGAWVTLGGCVPSMVEARAVRRWLYGQPGVAIVFDNTSFPPKNSSTPGYVDSVCSSSYLHYRREVAKWLLTPYRSDDPLELKTLPLIKDAAHRARVVTLLEETEDLEARGVHYLATALREIHRALYRWEPYHDDHRARVASLKMMFEVWAKMPARDDPCPGRGPGGHQKCGK